MLHIYASFPCFRKTSYIWNVSAQCVHFACKCIKMRVSAHVEKLVHLGRVAPKTSCWRVAWWTRKHTLWPVDNSVENFPCGQKNLSCPTRSWTKNLSPRWPQSTIKTSLGLRVSAKPCSMVLHVEVEGDTKTSRAARGVNFRKNLHNRVKRCSIELHVREREGNMATTCAFRESSFSGTPVLVELKVGSGSSSRR